MQTASEGVLDFASETVSYDIDKLAVFLKKILPHLEEELKDVASTENDLNTDQHHESVCNYDFAGEAGKVMEFNWKQISLQPECPKVKICVMIFA